jgi:Contractile injection system tube protein
VPDAGIPAKAQLVQIELGDGDADSRETNPDATVTVQFNPETLKVTYSNTMKGGDQSGGAAIQSVSKSSTKMSVELWFDAAALADEDDVRRLTKKVNHFITPIPQGEGMAPPAVRFTWGSFLFEGVMDAMDETLEYFSADGRPLRAKVSISITSQEIQFHEPPAPSSGGEVPGTSPQQQAQEGDSLQAMVGRDRGRGAGAEGWQAVAAANGIENPRRLEPGSFVDLNAARQTDARRGVPA